MLRRTLISCTFLLISGISFGQSSSYEQVIDSLSNIGQQAKIIPYLEQELKAKPNEELLLRMLGFYHIEDKNLDVAEQYYTQALAVNPTCSKCYMNIGRIYAMRNDFNKALENFNLGVLAAPKDGLIVLWRARLKEYQGDKTAALADYNLAVSLEPDNGAVYQQRALFHSSQGNFPLELADLNKTIALVPNDLKPYLHRATLHFKMENLDSACLDYEMAKKLSAQQKTKDTLLTDQLETAVQDICNPEKPSYYYQRGIAFYNQKQYQKAIAMYDLGLKKFPGNPLTLNFKGNAYLALQKPDQALLCYQLALQSKDSFLKAINANPRFSTDGKNQTTKPGNSDAGQVSKAFLAELHYHIAECQLALAAFPKALSEINQAIELIPDTAGFPKEMYSNLREQIMKKIRLQKNYVN